MIFIFFKQRATRRALRIARTARCPHRLMPAPRAAHVHGRWRGFGWALMLVGVLRPRSALLVLLVLFNFFELRALRHAVHAALDLAPHATAAHAASRAHRRRRGRLERGRLPALPWRPTDGRLPRRVVCGPPLRLSCVAGALLERLGRRTTRRREADRGGRRWRRRRPRRERRDTRCIMARRRERARRWLVLRRS